MTTPTRPRTLRALLAWAARMLDDAGLCFAQGTELARDEAAWLVLHALGEPVNQPLRRVDRELPPAAVARAQRLVRQRARTRRPAAYLTGRAWFCGLEFEVDERVIVPRSPMAELIARRFAPWCDARRVRRVLDVGTGSGCIAIACAAAFEHADVDACDISAKALAVARRNVRRHACDSRVRVLRSNVFESLGGARYDLIVSNPPYVPSRVVDALPEELRAEPRLGLDGGADGMDVVARILLRAGQHLTERGVLVVEVGDFVAEFRRQFATLPAAWPRLQHGGSGIFVVTREQLKTVASTAGDMPGG